MSESLPPSRKARSFKPVMPTPFEAEPLRQGPGPLAGRVLDTRPCKKCRFDLLGQPLDGKCPECGTPIIQSAPPRVKRAGAPHGVGDHRKCTNCGYDLHGLKPEGACPECGAPIAVSLPTARFSRTIVDAPLAWLRVFAFGSFVLACGGLGMLFGVIAWVAFGRLIGGWAMLCAGIAWWLGVLITTRPRPILPEIDTDPRHEWWLVRALARLSQAFCVVGPVVMIASMVSGSSPALEALGWASIAIAGLGLAPVFIYLGNLSSWAYDDGAMSTTRASIVIGPLWVVCSVVSVLNGWGGFIGLTPGIFWGGMFYLLLIVLPMVHLGRTMIVFSMMGPWAIANHVHEQARRERMRDDFARDRAAADAAREGGVILDTSQPERVLMPGDASKAKGPARAGDSIRPGHRRTPPKLG